MVYSEFTLVDLIERLGLTLEERLPLFRATPARAASELLRTVLETQAPLALAINTEKARSELIIAPILIEVHRVMAGTVSLFSGTDFTVDRALGLTCVCDFILSRSAEQLVVRAPVAVIVEAKNENFVGGYAQCGAAMAAARLFNDRAGNDIRTIYGAVTTGNLWRFLRLDGGTLAIDRDEYHLSELEKILGILTAMAAGQPVPAAA